MKSYLPFLSLVLLVGCPSDEDGSMPGSCEVTQTVCGGTEYSVAGVECLADATCVCPELLGYSSKQECVDFYVTQTRDLHTRLENDDAECSCIESWHRETNGAYGAQIDCLQPYLDRTIDCLNEIEECTTAAVEACDDITSEGETACQMLTEEQETARAMCFET